MAGIFLGSNLNLPWLFILTGLIPLPLLFFARQQKKIIILLSLGLIIFFAAAPYSHAVLNAVDASHLRFYNDRGTVEIKGMVASDPEVRDKSTHLQLTATGIKVD